MNAKNASLRQPIWFLPDDAFINQFGELPLKMELFRIGRKFSGVKADFLGKKALEIRLNMPEMLIEQSTDTSKVHEYFSRIGRAFLSEQEAIQAKAQWEGLKSAQKEYLMFAQDFPPYLPKGVTIDDIRSARKLLGF